MADVTDRMVEAAWKAYYASRDGRSLRSAIEAALREMPAPEPTQEPYCYVYEYEGVFRLHREFYPREYNGSKPDRAVPLYTAPPQRKPLTDEEIDRITDQQWAANNHKPVYAAHRAYARAVERAHGIKGDGDE